MPTDGTEWCYTVLAKREERVVLVANRWDRVVLYLLNERTE